MVRIGTLRAAQVVVLVCAGTFALSGCKFLKKGATDTDSGVGVVPVAEIDASAVVPATSGTAVQEGEDAAAPKAPEASNTADVARFPGETKVNDEAAKLVADFTLVHKSPPSTGSVATLPKGTDIVKLATFEDSTLISFVNPKVATEHLIGWVGKNAFIATPPTKKTCAKPQELFADNLCHQPCVKDDQCGKGLACSGVEVRASGDGGATSPVNFCQSIPDAGAKSVPVDAGSKKLTCVAPKTAAQFKNEKTFACRKACKTDADCKGQKAACAAAVSQEGKPLTACINE